ncbi:MAG: hypothetical protein A2X35_08945 [Elusimicrobia bacterium GWA2_61_42]|nr:MAG: hypothetical protein A2X35_08945 [Elusimicrobia bacterium GWA2_61_42]OGR75710.1 MAG: hypothetical protein A2X38_06890 [Elusimicrobia bacterium GWC2_61_25]
MTSVLLAAGFSPAAAGSFAELASQADANGAKAPAVNVGAAFPGMQTCSFTEAKNNTCVFTCKNGATVVRPAIQSQFVANGCAKFIMVSSDFQNKAAQPWAEAAKAAYENALDEGGLTIFADLKELPPGARRQLEQEWQTLPQGPGNSSEAFKMQANGRTAFVVQSYVNSDSLRVFIFNAAGVLVARGEGSSDSPLAWLPL